MKSLFYLKNAAAKASDSNSILLRYYLKSTKKYKVKGLGITCTKDQWNQEDQKVKRGNSSHTLFNRRLNKIAELIEELEEKKGSENITSEDVDLIVEAAIKNVEVKEVINQSEHINQAIEIKVKSLSVNGKSENLIYKYKRLKDIMESIEKKYSISINMDYIDKNNLQLKENIIEYGKSLGWSDSYIRDVMNHSNMAINKYNELKNKSIKTFNLKSFEINREEEKEAVYITLNEIKIFYNFIFDPTEEQLAINRNDLDYLKYYLVRCFSGVRLGDMNSDNFNNTRLQDFFTKKSLLLYTGKKKKTVNIPFIGNYLFDLCESLSWNFPEFKNDSEVSHFGSKESVTVKYYYESLIKPIRTIQVKRKKKIVYPPITEYLTSHTARKSFAMLVYDLTKSVLQVSKMLGHSSTEVTQRYLGLPDDFEKFEMIDLKF